MRETRRANWTVAGVVEAPVAQVWDVLLDGTAGLTPAHRQAIAQAPGVQRFTITHEQPVPWRMHVEADAARHSLAIEGEWWYRGVHTVEPHPRGSRLVYQVYNIAPLFSRWIATLMHLHYTAQMRMDLQQKLQAIAARLHCPAYLDPR